MSRTFDGTLLKIERPNFCVFSFQVKTRSLVTLPITCNLLRHLLQFLYTDELTSSTIGNDDDSTIRDLLILSDQLFVTRLRESCEMILVKRVNLKTCVNMLTFSKLYNAANLYAYCLEFACANLASLLESRQLESLLDADDDEADDDDDDDGDDDIDGEEVILNDLTRFYANWNRRMSSRVITPYSDAVSDDVVLEAHRAHSINPLGNRRRRGDEKADETRVTKRNKRRATKKSVVNDKSLEQTTMFAFDANDVTLRSSVVNNNGEVIANVKDDTFDVSVDKSDKSNVSFDISEINSNASNLTMTERRLNAIRLANEKMKSSNYMDANFPELSSPPDASSLSSSSYVALNRSNLSRSPSSNNNVINNKRMTRLSQKQRKRLSSSSSESHDLVGNVNEPVSSPSASPRNPWKIVEPIADTMTTTLATVTTATSRGREGNRPVDRRSMNVIINETLMEKVNYNRMLTKSLAFTQVNCELFYSLFRHFVLHVFRSKIERWTIWRDSITFITYTTR